MASPFRSATVLLQQYAEYHRDQRNIVTLRADWTRRDPEITRELTRLGRSGVPVYALHLPSGEAPVLLSEILRVAELRRVLEQAPSARADGSTSPVTAR